MNIAAPVEVFYPDTDGLPMADNTLQYDWIVLLVGELRDMFAGQEVFVAGNLFWYPVEGEPTTVSAPDCMVVFGRQTGYRGSYQQWEEGGIGPQVVFEVLSPSNTTADYEKRFKFFETHGVEEYYFIDPYDEMVEGYRRSRDKLVPVAKMKGYRSPRLGVTFDWHDEKFVLIGQDGRVFQTREARFASIIHESQRWRDKAIAHKQAEREAKRIAEAERMKAEAEQKKAEAEQKKAEAERKLAEIARSRADMEQARADIESKRADLEEQRADAEKRRAEVLIAKLRELGVDPDSLT